MQATLRDAYAALTPRNCLLFFGLAVCSGLLLGILGYMIWRRFPVPCEIIAVAFFAWKIARIVGHPGLEKVVNAGSLGLGGCGIMLLVFALIDGWLWPAQGYFSWAGQIILWGWILFNIWRAYVILKEMPPDRRIHVTESTADIYMQMTYREMRSREARQAYEKVKETIQPFCPESV
jgi:hypothetical protein